MVHNTRNAAKKNALVRFATPAQHIMSEAEKEALLRAPKAPSNRRRANSISPVKPPLAVRPQRQPLRRSERQRKKNRGMGEIDEDEENMDSMEAQIQHQDQAQGAGHSRHSLRFQTPVTPRPQHRVVDDSGNTILESPWGSPGVQAVPRQLSYGGALDTGGARRPSNDLFGSLRRSSGEYKIAGSTTSSKHGSPTSSNDSSIPCSDSPSKRAPLRRSDEWVTESGQIARSPNSAAAIVYPNHPPPYAWAVGPNLTLKLRDDGSPMLI